MNNIKTIVVSMKWVACITIVFSKQYLIRSKQYNSR